MGTPSISRSHDSNNRIGVIISLITAFLVFSVALGSFALSYNALREISIRNGITGWLSFIWPMLIDFSLIVFSLAVVTAYLRNESTWKQWLLVAVYTIATIGFNVAHAPNGLQAQIVAGIAPVSLFFSFELLMSQLKSSVKRHGVTHGIKELSQQAAELDSILAQKSEKVSSLNQQIDTLQVQISELINQKNEVIRANDTPNDTSLSKANDTRQAQIESRREQVLNLLQQEMSHADIASELGVSIATVKRDTKALNGRVIL